MHRDYNNDSDAGGCPKYNDTDFFDDDDNAAKEDLDIRVDYNSNYNTNEIEVDIIEDTDNCYITKIDDGHTERIKCGTIDKTSKLKKEEK